MSPLERKGSIRLVFVGLVLAMLLASLDQTTFSTALPTVIGEMGGVHQMMWVHTAYILAATLVMPIYGKLGDLMGRKWLSSALWRSSTSSRLLSSAPCARPSSSKR